MIPRRNEPAEAAPPHDSAIALVVAALGLIAGLATGLAAQAEEAGAGGHRERARELLASERPSRAVHHLRRHLEAHPEDLETRALLAGTYARLGLRSASLQEIHLVLAERPEDEGALQTLAGLQYRDGRLEDALETLRRLRTGRAEPSHRAGTAIAGSPSAVGLMDAAGPTDALEGRILFRLGRHAEASEPIARAIGSGPASQALLALQGLNALGLGGEEQLDLARGAFERALELAPDDASLHNNLGVVHERSGELEPAFLQYLEAEGLSDGKAYGVNRRRLEAALSRR